MCECELIFAKKKKFYWINFYFFRKKLFLYHWQSDMFCILCSIFKSFFCHFFQEQRIYNSQIRYPWFKRSANMEHLVNTYYIISIYIYMSNELGIFNIWTELLTWNLFSLLLIHKLEVWNEAVQNAVVLHFESIVSSSKSEPNPLSIDRLGDTFFDFVLLLPPHRCFLFYQLHIVFRCLPFFCLLFIRTFNYL